MSELDAGPRLAQSPKTVDAPHRRNYVNESGTGTGDQLPATHCFPPLSDVVQWLLYCDLLAQKRVTINNTSPGKPRIRYKKEINYSADKCQQQKQNVLAHRRSTSNVDWVFN
jgi:hypothetical protein